MSVRKALNWLKQLDLGPIYVETYALLAASAISHGTRDVSCFCMIIEDCIALLKDLPNCKISHFRRSVNHVAHIFTKVSDSMSYPRVWTTKPPYIIVDVGALNLDNEKNPTFSLKKTSLYSLPLSR